MNAAKASYSYMLSPTGSRKQVTESSGRVVNWSYDGIYRLTNETISLDPHSVNGSVGYGLDPVGNRESQTSTIPGIGTGSFTYDPDDRLNTETYDFNGNTLTTGGKTFAYDFENRLKSMTAGSVAVTIQYDADGNRVAKTVNGVTTRYLVDDLNPTGYAQVVEEVTAGAVTRQYTYGLQRISQTQQIANAWTPAFYGYDGGGTVRLLTDGTGTVTDTYDYDAWGNEVNTTGSTPNVYLYRGEQYDADLGLYYLRARYFDPLTGRFLTKDPADGNVLDPRTLHKYLYVHGDPVNRVDPTGRMEYTMILGDFSLPGTMAAASAAVLAVACVAEPVTVGMSMGVAAALGYKISDVHLSGTCPMILTFSWQADVARLPRPAPQSQPLVCTPQRLAELEAIKNAACGPAKGACKSYDSCTTIGAKVIAKAACIGARVEIMIECYSGGNFNHQIPVDQFVKEIEDCMKFKKTCKP